MLPRDDDEPEPVPPLGYSLLLLPATLDDTLKGKFVMLCHKVETAATRHTTAKEWRAWYTAKVVKHYPSDHKVHGGKYNYELAWLGGEGTSGTMLSTSNYFAPGGEAALPGSWVLMEKQ